MQNSLKSFRNDTPYILFYRTRDLASPIDQKPVHPLLVQEVIAQSGQNRMDVNQSKQDNHNNKPKKPNKDHGMGPFTPTS